MTDLLPGLLEGDRRSLARAITLIESTRSDHVAKALHLLDRLPAQSESSVVVGVSGTPGVGKSTLIDRLGCHLIELGHRPAVLAVDPSSTISRGSILGDKTRMPELSQKKEAFIRPSPSQGILGGVAATTRRAVRLCEAAGHDVVIVETVGIGQSEADIDQIVDLFVFLIGPGGGDEIQGIKRGVMELVDLVVATKDDDLHRPLVDQAVTHYQNALHLFRPKHRAFSPSVIRCSALDNVGIDAMWQTIADQHRLLRHADLLTARRERQRVHAMAEEMRLALLRIVAQDSSELLQSMQAVVANGDRDPGSAAAEIVRSLLGRTES